MNSNLLDYKLTFMFTILIMYPGLAFALFLHDSFGKLLVFSVVALIGLFLFYKDYSIFNDVKGFFKRLVISIILVSGSYSIASISPEAKNAFAGAILFLFIPSLFVSNYLLYKSKPALKVKALYKRASTSKLIRTNNSWLFAPASLILANNFLPLNEALTVF